MARRLLRRRPQSIRIGIPVVIMEVEVKIGIRAVTMVVIRIGTGENETPEGLLIGTAAAEVAVVGKSTGERRACDR